MCEPIMVGCDLHDRTMLLRIGVGREEGRTVAVTNTVEGRRKMIADLQQLSQARGGARVVFAYEASGLGFGLHDELTGSGIECHVLAPTNMTRTPKQRRAKTDEKDAEQILQLLRSHVLAGNPLPAVWIPDLATRDDRNLVRTRLDVADKQRGIKTQVQSLLKRHRLVRPEGLKSSWTKHHRLWLRSLLPNLERGARVALESLLRQLDFLEQETDRLDEEVVQLSLTPRYAARVVALAQLQGVGVLTAMVFLTELGDPKRFRNRRQVGAYLGLIPACNESGEQNDRKGHITRQGPSRVRKVLCQAAWSRVRNEGVDEEAYHRLVAKNPKHKKIAVVAVMRRLAVRMWHEACEAPPDGGTLYRAVHRRAAVPTRDHSQPGEAGTKRKKADGNGPPPNSLGPRGRQPAAPPSSVGDPPQRFRRLPRLQDP